MAEPEKQTKMEFPREFKACPDCGSTRRLSQAAVIGEYLSPQARGKPTAMMTMVYANPGPITTVVATGQVDICYDCGRLYSVAQNRVKISNDEFRKQFQRFGA